MTLNNFESKLLQGWEDVHKKSQLTLWILLALHARPMHMVEIKEFITRITKSTIIADDKSMYRALRRFNDVGMITFTTQPSEGGPDRKVYELTSTGKKVLQAFIQQNIEAVFYDSDVKRLIQSAL